MLNTMYARILTILLIPCLSGCAYLHDRGRDACDMVTVAAEAPTLNASIQLGKSVLGIGAAGGKGVGLRSGSVGVYDTSEANLVLFGAKLFVPRERDLDRNKGYDYTYMWFPWRDDENEFLGTFEEGEWFNAWQLEAALGLGVGVRVGVNLAEIADCLLGWTALDICDDDLATIEAKELRKHKGSDNNVLEDIGTNAPNPQP